MTCPETGPVLGGQVIIVDHIEDQLIKPSCEAVIVNISFMVEVNVSR